MKNYSKPTLIVSDFFSNENISACYKIRCTTPNRNDTYKYIYDDSNNNNKWDNDDTIVYSSKNGFRGCNRWHIGIIQDIAPESNGFVTVDIKGTKASEVYWWNEDLGHDVIDYHVMVPGKENYETNPNAS